jgi:hypothetical protein
MSHAQVTARLVRVHAVVALALPAVEAFDSAIPAQVFGDRRLGRRYSFTVCAPVRTVRTDVDRVLWARQIPSDVRVSGHVYDVTTGLVTTVVDAKSRK